MRWSAPPSSAQAFRIAHPLHLNVQVWPAALTCIRPQPDLRKPAALRVLRASFAYAHLRARVLLSSQNPFYRVDRSASGVGSCAKKMRPIDPLTAR